MTSMLEDPSEPGLYTIVDGGPLTETPGGSGLFDYDDPVLLSSVGALVEDPPGSGLFTFLMPPVVIGTLDIAYSVDLCRNWVRIGEALDVEFSGVNNHLEIGEWVLSASPNAVEFGYYPDPDNPGQYLQWGPEDVDTIRVVEDNHIIYPGYVADPDPDSDSAGGFERNIDANGERWIWSGPDLWHAPAGRRAYPDPTVETSGPWANIRDTRTGIASTVLANFLSDNMAAAALTAREVDGFVVNDEGEGPVGTWSARLEWLHDLARRICQDAEIVCRWTIDFDAQITATVGAPRNLSDSIVISDQGDIAKLIIRQIRAKKTHVIAGGTGTGTSRVFRVASSGATGINRRETFLDLSGITDTDELLAAATTQVRLGAASSSVYVEVTDEFANNIRFGRDVLLGDIVAVDVDGHRIAVPVTSISYQISAERTVIRPTLGTAVPDRLRSLLHKLDNVARKGESTIA